jgi:hypothetical protein
MTRTCVPLTQNEPGVHTDWLACNAGVGPPVEKLPTPTGNGADAPSGQYTLLLPHANGRLLSEPDGQ